MSVLHNAKEISDYSKTAMEFYVKNFIADDESTHSVLENIKVLLAWLLLNYSEIKSKDVSSLSFIHLNETMIAFLSNLNQELVSILIQYLMDMIITIDNTLH
jgi:hypothetical protein